MKDNYVYATYIDKKIYLLGLQGLYYSLIATNTKYNLIILYCGEIEEKDIWKYIDKKQVILYKIKNNLYINKERKINFKKYNSIMDGKKCFFLDWVYYASQYNSALNPLYLFNFLNYQAVLFLHCDMLIINNLDYMFNTNKGNYIAYCNNFYKNEKDELTPDMSRCLFFPSKEVWDFILTKLTDFNNTDHLNMDFVFAILMEKFKMKTFPKKNINIMPSLKLIHFGGALKWWTAFPQCNIKKIIQKKDKEKIIKFMRNKIEKIKNDDILTEQYHYSINGNYIDAYNK